MPSVSEASLASLGTASPLTSFQTASRDVFPRRASAEGPPRLTPLVDKNGGVRGDKKVGSGRQQEGLHKNILNTASEGMEDNSI